MMMPLGGPLISVQEALGFGPEPPKPLTAKEAEAAAEAEDLTLALSDKSATGFKSVGKIKNSARPYVARASCNGHALVLGCFATPQEAALVIARRVAEEGVALAEDEHAMSSQEAEAAAAAAGLTIARSTRAPLASWASPRGRSRGARGCSTRGRGG
mmetsp:Transcript_19158/g.58264  ORF Transcript_19158/g.58264 Transcript_19158/m.58264 type:complete len:157 (-) Transcript_19158:15-485(-)